MSNLTYSLKPQGRVLGDCRKCGARCVPLSKKSSRCVNCKK